jgi:hypothetical protein
MLDHLMLMNLAKMPHLFEQDVLEQTEAEAALVKAAG